MLAFCCVGGAPRGPCSQKGNPCIPLDRGGGESDHLLQSDAQSIILFVNCSSQTIMVVVIGHCESLKCTHSSIVIQNPKNVYIVLGVKMDGNATALLTNANKLLRGGYCPSKRNVCLVHSLHLCSNSGGVAKQRLYTSWSFTPHNQLYSSQTPRLEASPLERAI